MKRFGLTALGGAAALVLGLLWARPLTRATLPPRLSVAPSQLIADGYDTATLTIDEPSPVAPGIVVAPAYAGAVQDVSATNRGWQAKIRVGVTPGIVVVRVQFPGRPPAVVRLLTNLDPTDSAADGTPDFLRLDDIDDQRAFRRWFTFLAETQYFQAAARRPAEIVDCAALIRYAYRETLRASRWRLGDGGASRWRRASLSVTKYQYPYTPLGADLFRVRPGRFEPGDSHQRRASRSSPTRRRCAAQHSLRDPRPRSRAQPGDLLFYRHDATHAFHSMIYLGDSQFEQTPSAISCITPVPMRRPGRDPSPDGRRTAALSGARLAAAPGQSPFPGRLPLEHSEEDIMKLLRLSSAAVLAAPGLSQSGRRTVFRALLATHLWRGQQAVGLAERLERGLAGVPRLPHQRPGQFFQQLENAHEFGGRARARRMSARCWKRIHDVEARPADLHPARPSRPVHRIAQRPSRDALARESACRPAPAAGERSTPKRPC